MKRILNILAGIAALSVLASCGFMHDDQQVARVGKNILYKSQLDKFIPAGLSQADSLAMVKKYVDSWATTIIMNEMAQEQLSKEEMDISRELADFRNSLIKYRYEQHYISDRLDTVVTMQQIEECYRRDSSLFTLTVPIIKGRYLRIQEASPMKDQLLGLMKSEDEDDVYMLDSLARISATRYRDFSGSWVDLVTIAREYGSDYGTLIANLNNHYIRIVDDLGLEHITYVQSYIPSGKIPPIEYCGDKIREVIVSKRKYALSTSLEQDLLDNALKKGKLIIYNDEE